MRTLSRLLVAALLTACAKSEEPAPPAAAPPAAAAPTLADFAGTWTNTVTLTGAAKPVPSTITGAADPASWTLSLEGRPNIKLTVSIAGDSLVSVSDEYESVLRAGVKVTVRTAAVLKDGKLVGAVTATYKTPTGTEVVPGTIEGTRAH